MMLMPLILILSILYAPCGPASYQIHQHFPGLLCHPIGRPHVHVHKLCICTQAKEMLEGAGFAKDGQAVILGGALIAGFCAAACSLPFDFVKTRIQKMEKQADGSYPYKSPVDCAVKTFREEGFLRFYTGFPTYCLR